MSPEQAEMRALGVIPQRPSTSLGVLLYELLTGARRLTQAVQGGGYAEILRMIQGEGAAQRARG